MYRISDGSPARWCRVAKVWRWLASEGVRELSEAGVRRPRGKDRAWNRRGIVRVALAALGRTRWRRPGSGGEAHTPFHSTDSASGPRASGHRPTKGRVAPAEN